jgi:hypothetical protein
MADKLGWGFFKLWGFGSLYCYGKSLSGMTKKFIP